MWSAWERLVNASATFDSDLFRYDLVDITKEVLHYKFASVYMQLLTAYNQSDLYGVRLVFAEEVLLIEKNAYDLFQYPICNTDGPFE